MHALTTVISGTGVQLCNWAVNAGGGSLLKLACASHRPLALTAGGTPALPRRVELVSLLGRVTAGTLKLALWRVGHKD